MQFYITNFNNIRYFTPNMIPISTGNSDPKFFHADSYNKKKCFIDKNGIINGIREEAFLLPEGFFEHLEEHCQANCPFKYKNPNCGFLIEYRKHLDTINFNYLLKEFNRVAEDARKITYYEGEPIIVLLVWEAENNPCSERKPIQDYFKKHGIELKNWSKKEEINFESII